MASEEALGDTSVTLAVIIGAHGVTGEVRLKLFGEGVATLSRFHVFNDSVLTLKKLRDDGKGGAIARFAEVTDRNGAEALRGTELAVSRSVLPPLGDGEYYYADLIGLAAVSDAGEVVGAVLDVQNFGAGDILEIKRPDGKRFMVPMNEAAVPEWNGERVVINATFAE